MSKKESRAERENFSRVLAAINKIQQEEMEKNNILRNNPLWLMREVNHAIADNREGSIREYSAKLSAHFLEKWK